MNARARLTALATILIVSACGGGGSSDSSEPPVAATSTAPPAQPKGAYGVTYEIQNWAEHADDPVVLAWKKIEEAANSTINNEKVPDYVRGRVPAETLKNLTQNLANAKGRGFYVQDVAKVRIESAKTTGDTAVLVVCGWVPTIDLYQKDGTLYGDEGGTEVWDKTQVAMRSGSNGWVVTEFKQDGTCVGPPPD